MTLDQRLHEFREAAEQAATDGRYSDASALYQQLADVTGDDSVASLHYLTLATNFAEGDGVAPLYERAVRLSLDTNNYGKAGELSVVAAEYFRRHNQLDTSRDWSRRAIAYCSKAMYLVAATQGASLGTTECSDIEHFAAQITYCLTQLRQSGSLA